MKDNRILLSNRRLQVPFQRLERKTSGTVLQIKFYLKHLGLWTLWGRRGQPTGLRTCTEPLWGQMKSVTSYTVILSTPCSGIHRWFSTSTVNGAGPDYSTTNVVWEQGAAYHLPHALCQGYTASIALPLPMLSTPARCPHGPAMPISSPLYVH